MNQTHGHASQGEYKEEGWGSEHAEQDIPSDVHR